VQRLNRTWLAALLALTSAVLTLLLYFALQPDRRSVVVAARDLQPFSPIGPQDLAVIRVDEATAARMFPNAYQSVKELKGMMTLRHFRTNEVLSRDDPGLTRQEQLADIVAGKDLPTSYMIPERYRAVPVSAALPTAVPGDYVELYAIGKRKPVLSRPVQVVANQGSTLLVLVPKEDVEALLSAQAMGSLQAVLTPSPAGKEETAWSG